MGNQFRTAVLLAAMTAFILVIGQLLGGRQGMFIALIFAGGMNFFSYWYSDKLVLKMYRAQPITAGEAPELYETVRILANRAGLPMPKVYIIPQDQPNAFATGRNPDNAAVAVTRGLMNLMDRDEIEGVLAHELAHVKNRDILIGTIAATMAGAIMMLASMARWGAIFGGMRSDDDEGGMGIFGVIAMSIIAPMAAMLIQMAISRSREYLADSTGAAIAGRPDGLARALEKLGAYSRSRVMDANPSTAHMFIVNPLSAQKLSSLFSTHPPIEERVARLNGSRPAAPPQAADRAGGNPKGRPSGTGYPGDTMNSTEQKQIAAWLTASGGSCELELINDGSVQAKALERFCQQLTDCGPGVTIKNRPPDTDAEKAAIVIGRRLKYQAVPLGPELGPFLETAASQMDQKSDPPAAGAHALEALTVPAHLDIYIAPQCPHCPQTVGQLLPMIQANHNISITVIDGTLFTDLADMARIKSVPTVMLDTDFRWTGSVDMNELTDTIINRDPVKLGPLTLRSFIDDGRAADLAQMMIKAQTVFPALINLITHDLWSIRLGAMVVAEEIAWEDRPLAGTLIPALEKRFADVNETVQGDILHVIGESGAPPNLPFLESVAAAADNEDLREAARDAIASIREYTVKPGPTD